MGFMKEKELRDRVAQLEAELKEAHFYKQDFQHLIDSLNQVLKKSSQRYKEAKADVDVLKKENKVLRQHLEAYVDDVDLLLEEMVFKTITRSDGTKEWYKDGKQASSGRWSRD